MGRPPIDAVYIFDAKTGKLESYITGKTYQLVLDSERFMEWTDDEDTHYFATDISKPFSIRIPVERNPRDVLCINGSRRYSVWLRNADKKEACKLLMDYILKETTRCMEIFAKRTQELGEVARVTTEALSQIAGEVSS